MYYIINNEERYYAGKCYSDKRTPVWKNHSTRAMGFETMKEALDFARDVLKFPSDKQKLNIHSTQKPLDLLRYMIRTYTNEGDTILDFTAGSMSVSVAAYLEGRNSVCIEMDTEQFNKSVQWVENCTFDSPYRTKVTNEK